MELSRVVITEYGADQLIFLRETGGERSFPIVVGTHEALAIHRRLNGERTPRPMTHDLLANVIEALGGAVEQIVIEDLRMLNHQDVRQTFIATVHIRCGDRLVKVDSRPSDAIALGAAFGTPILVAQKVLDSVLNDSAKDRVGMLREHMAMLGEKIAELDQRLHDKEFVSETPGSILKKAQIQLEQMKAEYDAIDRILKMYG